MQSRVCRPHRRVHVGGEGWPVLSSCVVDYLDSLGDSCPMAVKQRDRHLCGWRVAVRSPVGSGGAVVLALRIWQFSTYTAKGGHTIQRLAISRIVGMVVVAWIGTAVVERPVGGVWELMNQRRARAFASPLEAVEQSLGRGTVPEMASGVRPGFPAPAAIERVITADAEMRRSAECWRLRKRVIPASTVHAIGEWRGKRRG
ncbi:hypothetical protein EAH_00057810 [Eimeria acervulina]|uniref:Uncharacterized protein n=1 Tax=Eimeria acervulina TaxID=5801 RepID=U6GN17_EIMAC|nr:hypothetical protein EAH_00057810 [Eimeria acervulina]CDI80982.1 hypothetical protein EAH_00057810 [Eimeria acervulina]